MMTRVKLPENIISLINDEPVIGHFATSVDDSPHVTPVWLDYDPTADLILIDTMSDALKLKHVRQNPKISISFVSPGNSSLWVAIKGAVVSIDDMGDDCSHVQALAYKYLGRSKGYPGHRVILNIQISRFRWWGETAPTSAVDTNESSMVSDSVLLLQPLI
jgi:general stress protein 26